jgi:hypothetical protein
VGGRSREGAAVGGDVNRGRAGDPGRLRHLPQGLARRRELPELESPAHGIWGGAPPVPTETQPCGMRALGDPPVRFVEFGRFSSEATRRCSGRSARPCPPCLPCRALSGIVGLRYAFGAHPQREPWSPGPFNSSAPVGAAACSDLGSRPRPSRSSSSEAPTRARRPTSWGSSTSRASAGTRTSRASSWPAGAGTPPNGCRITSSRSASGTLPTSSPSAPTTRSPPGCAAASNRC